MASRILPIGMVQAAAFASLAPARKVIATGERATDLAASVMARTVSERKTVRLICGDNRFDPYAVARRAKRLGVRAEDALRSIRIARAFTAFQLTELIDRLSHNTSSELIVISGPCSTFFDEDIPLVDAARLFYRTLWRIVELARGSSTILLVQGAMPVSARRAYFLTDLCRASDIVLRLGGQHTFTLEHKGRLALPHLAAVDRLLSE